MQGCVYVKGGLRARMCEVSECVCVRGTLDVR